MPNPMESGWAPMLCIDCGGVLTKYGTKKYDGEDIYKATMEGAWAFLLLWQAAYGEDAVRIISKVNWFPKKEKHWVTRHAVSIGLSSDQVFLTDHGGNKGYYARRSNATVVVDDKLDCLQSMMTGSSKSLQTAVLFGGADPQNQKNVHCLLSHRDLACLLEVYPNGTVWEWLVEQGPPHKPHDESVREELLRRLKAMDDARSWQPLNAKRKVRSSEAASASSTKWVAKGPASSSAPGNDDDADDDERPPPTDNVVFLYRKSAAKKPEKMKHEDHEEPPPPSRPPKQSAMKEEPDYGDQDDDKDDDDDKCEESSSSAEEDDEEEDTESDAKKIRRSSSKKTASRPHRRRRSTSTDEKIKDLQNQVKQLQWQQSAGWYYKQQYYPAAAQASQPAMSAPAAAAGPALGAAAMPPVWQGRRPDSGWTQAKLKRAERHRAGGQQKQAQRLTPAISCSQCGKNQPGAYCPSMCCRRCCMLSNCPQHHG